MMGGGAFVLLKTGRFPPQSAKQDEIRLGVFLKILNDGAPAMNRARPFATDKASDGCFGPNSANYG
jgi:hypothetical protein